ncbi:MAG TPA: SrtB family sortase, partial [Lachnospiraceae bacterium]|nr:SrtB family sortase [Lachnospiraceae bacterium]
DSEYLEEHPYVYIYTEDGLLVYEIFAAYQSSDEHILYAHDNFEDRKVYGKYLEDILNMRSMGSVVKEGTEVTEDSRILTLSTCISGRPNNRFLVQGVLLNGD